MPESPFDQRRYQVRQEWGASGLGLLAPAEIVIVVDVLRFSTTVTDALEARRESSRGSGREGADGAGAAAAGVPLDATAHAVSLNGAAVAEAAAASGAVVMLGCLRNASAVARAVLAEQQRRGARTSVSIIAAGEVGQGSLRQAQGPEGEARGPEGPQGELRFAVEDQLGAGAIIAALGEAGIDHTSPEAAAAGEVFRGLRGALRHLLSASGSGQELLSRDMREQVLAAAEVDAASVVPVLRDGVFVAY